MAIAAMSFVACTEKRDLRIACVGDSITEGMGIEWQSENSYPAQLDKKLGDGFEVMNLGRSSTTMMIDGDFPYWSAKEFTDVFRYHPDLIIIKLGTNDAKLKQWNPAKYRESYQRTIDTFLTITPKPDIMLCKAVPPQQTRWEITDSIVNGEVNPIVEELAKKNNLKLIDLYEAVGHKEELFVKDGIHPNAAGAAVMAEEVAKFVRDFAKSKK